MTEQWIVRKAHVLTPTAQILRVQYILFAVYTNMSSGKWEIRCQVDHLVGNISTQFLGTTPCAQGQLAHCWTILCPCITPVCCWDAEFRAEHQSTEGVRMGFLPPGSFSDFLGQGPTFRVGTLTAEPSLHNTRAALSTLRCVAKLANHVGLCGHP